MAVQANVSGLTTIKIQVPSGSLLTLGYARNEPEVSLQPLVHDVHSDENGGDQGDPVEIQLLGVIALIRLRMTKYDPAVSEIVEKIASQASVVGTPPTPGTLLFAASHTLRVLLASTTDPRNYPRCVVRSAIEVNRGTKYSELVCEFTAYKNASGVLWNDTVV